MWLIWRTLHAFHVFHFSLLYHIWLYDSCFSVCKWCQSIVWFIYFKFQAELIEPALKGTLNVLASCKKCSIKRVVVTSSMAAVSYNDKPRTPDVVVDETWFSSPEVCKREKVSDNIHWIIFYCFSVPLFHCHPCHRFQFLYNLHQGSIHYFMKKAPYIMAIIFENMLISCQKVPAIRWSFNYIFATHQIFVHDIYIELVRQCYLGTFWMQYAVTWMTLGNYADKVVKAALGEL